LGYIKELWVISLLAGIVLIGSAAADPPPGPPPGGGVETVDCGAAESIQAVVDDADGPTTVFITGICVEDVSITKDDITLSGNQAGAVCNKADPSASAAAMIDGTITVDGVRARIEFLQITGSGIGVNITSRADARLTCNDISNNDESGVIVVRSSHAVLTDNTLSRNGQQGFDKPFVFFDAGLYVLDASSVLSNGNTYKDNQYAAVGVARESSFRSGTFLPREPGHAPIPGETDTMIQKGGDPSNAATCKVANGLIAIETFNSGLVDLRNANVCGKIDSIVNSSFRIDDAGGELIGNVNASSGSHVRIKDHSILGDGRLTTFDGTLTCDSTSGTFFSTVQCGQTCSGAIPGSCVSSP
jgi:parallel beta-helix repeat protein